MTAALYDLAPYLDQSNPEHVWCEATWTWRVNGETARAVGDYLDVVNGSPALRCGIWDAAPELDLPVDWFTDEFVLAVSAKLYRQLSLAPWATLHCPDGTLRVELTAPRG
ncbi:hypothetical protein BST28_17430 [Mycolicibacter kumamotonensis]|uniref:Uncharacterized protein n=1 Tax=Mycolicibacter kumamotonensis TaxID=354243 RepID=A0A1X0DYN4_9MYCO|nr:hypothetical protein [Mycolicibacter kumamotonensis]ORA77584.1 hypothetical protein BST28_17430 [Mycolicibacter kumamotonensis]